MNVYGKKAAAQLMAVTVPEIDRMIAANELQSRFCKDRGGRAVEVITAESIAKTRVAIDKTREDIRRITSYEAVYCRDLHIRSVTLQYSDPGIRKGRISLNLFDFFDTASTAKVRKIWKLIFQAEEPADTAAEIDQYLESASGEIKQDLDRIKDAKKRLVNEVYACHAPKSYIGKMCETEFRRMDRKEKHLKKRLELFQKWRPLFKWD